MTCAATSQPSKLVGCINLIYLHITCHPFAVKPLAAFLPLFSGLQRMILKYLKVHVERVNTLVRPDFGGFNISEGVTHLKPR